jgi:hypothetical protein
MMKLLCMQRGVALPGSAQSAINSTGHAATDKTYALGIIASPFPQVHASDLGRTYPTSAPGTTQAAVTRMGAPTEQEALTALGASPVTNILPAAGWPASCPNL